MIFGIFSGTTPSTILKKIERWEGDRRSIDLTIEQAKADRMAALAEIREELALLDSFNSRLKGEAE